MGPGLNQRMRQLANQLLQHSHAVLRLGVLLLLCSPSLLISSTATDDWRGAGSAGQRDSVLLTTVWEHNLPPKPAEGDASDDRDKPSVVVGSNWPIRAARAMGSTTKLSDGRERLPDPPDYLHAQLRAPPLA